MPFTSSGSAMMSVIVMRGLSEENGSWKIICIWRRSGRSSGLGRRGDVDLPAGLGAEADRARRSACSARRMQREVVVLPQPDSPTSERVSPRRMLKLTSSTARTWPTTRRSRPRRIGNHLRRLSTSRMVEPAGRARTALRGSSSVGTGAVAPVTA